jgi:hypothetical protein
MYIIIKIVKGHNTDKIYFGQVQIVLKERQIWKKIVYILYYNPANVLSLVKRVEKGQNSLC